MKKLKAYCILGIVTTVTVPIIICCMPVALFSTLKILWEERE